MPREPRIEEIDQNPRDRVLAPHRVRRFYIFFAPLIVAVLIGILGGFFFFRADGFSLPGTFCIVMAGFLFLFYIIFETFFIGVYPARCYLHWLRQNIDARSDAIVDADDPDAFFVQHIPRKKWTVSVGENATDMGLFLIDYEAGVIKFEGDEERWIIPRDSIMSFRIDSFVPPMGNEMMNRFTVVMLRIEFDDGEILLTPLAPQPIHWQPWTVGCRARGAEALRRAIGHFVAPKKYQAPDDDELHLLIPPRR
jgi:hypothetical protein